MSGVILAPKQVLLYNPKIVLVPAPLFKLPEDKGLSVASAPVVGTVGLQTVALHSADKGLRATGVDFGARQGGGSEISPIVTAGSSSSDGIVCQPPVFLGLLTWLFLFFPSFLTGGCPHRVAGWLFSAHLLH